MSDPAGEAELRAELERLRRRLAARERTIAVLMDRVDQRQVDASSALAILHQNIAMEELVALRTRELEATTHRLAEALEHVRRSQAEVVDAQRLAAVGALAAGVAHEINTPVQFVNDSVQFLHDAHQDIAPLIFALLEVRRVVTALAGDAADPALMTAIDASRSAEEQADLDYLVEQIPAAFSRCLDGLQRVATIVRSLKEFAHPAAQEMAPADLNNAIRATVTMARNEYKYVAELVCELEEELPKVTCLVGDINQVVLNLVVNAAHAVADAVAATGATGRITVRTRRDGDDVVIEVEDTGTGIPPEIRNRVFEPFFTTKEVGKGTGQGLAIAWTIINDRHGGRLWFESTMGVGTRFLIRLPIAGHVRAAA